MRQYSNQVGPAFAGGEVGMMGVEDDEGVEDDMLMRGGGGDEALLGLGMGGNSRPPLAAKAKPEDSTVAVNGALNLLLKLLFYATIILQVVLWPSVMTIVFAGILGTEGLMTLLFSTCGGAGENGALLRSVTDYSLLLLHNREVRPGKYIAAALIFAYQLVFFVLYAAHSPSVLPAQTTWLGPSVYTQYRFTPEGRNLPLPVDVTSKAAYEMRERPFVWPRVLQRPAMMINGSIPKANVQCGAPSFGAAYQCFSAKLAAFAPPAFSDAPAMPPGAFALVPFASRFYTADVIVTPPSGVPCGALEVYRIVLDGDQNVVYDLDYPASATEGMVNVSSGARYSKCGMFLGSPNWCLAFQHPFSDMQYRARIVSKCADSSNGQLVIRLPSRAEDVDGNAAKIGYDILLVTPGANVQMRWLWHDADQPSPLLNVWEQTDSAYSDTAQSWRDATDSGAVFFKFLVITAPLTIVWYYLTVTLKEVLTDYQVPMTCLFVLIPAGALFMTVGAWLPMAGAIVCLVAIHHAPYQPGINRLIPPYIRYLLLFITSASNATYLIWILVLVGQAGWSAFFYDTSIRQLGDTTNQFIVSGYPNWVGLLLPSVLLTNVAFLLGAGICVGMELAAHARSSTSGTTA